MILMLSTTLLSLLLCLKMGRVFFIIGKILGLCGLHVDMKAKVFLSCVFAFTFLSSPFGMSLVLLMALVIRFGRYSLLRRMLLRWFILLVVFSLSLALTMVLILLASLNGILILV